VHGPIAGAELGPGALSGVESLWSSSATPPVVHAVDDCEWLYLSAADYAALRGDNPSLALALLHFLLQARTAREGVGERVLPRRSTIHVVVCGETREVEMGTPYGALLPASHGGLPVVAALADHKATSLSTPVTSGGRVDPLTTRDWEGQHIYRHSLALLALEAAHRIARDAGVRMGPSVGFGRRILVDPGATTDLDEFGRRLQAEMNELIARDLPLSEEHWANGRASKRGE
jgi:uridine kinase